jgi:hypothetical protein
LRRLYISCGGIGLENGGHLHLYPLTAMTGLTALRILGHGMFDINLQTGHGDGDDGGGPEVRPVGVETSGRHLASMRRRSSVAELGLD